MPAGWRSRGRTPKAGRNVQAWCTAVCLHGPRRALTAQWAAGPYALTNAMDSVRLDVPRLALAVVEAQVGSLVDVLPVAVLIADGDGMVIRANDAAQELLEQHALVGRQITELLRTQHLEVRERCLVHGDEVLRLYVIYPR